MDVANNYFDKTCRNLLADGKSELLFRSKEGKAYQVKGTLEYHTDSEVFDHMKTGIPRSIPGTPRRSCASKKSIPAQRRSAESGNSNMR